MKRIAVQLAFAIGMAGLFSYWPMLTVGLLAYCLIAEGYERVEQGAHK